MGRKAGLATEDVVGTAAALADRYGLDHLTLARLADELSIKPPSLYNHVDGLEGLHLELALIGADRITERLVEARDGKEPEESLRSMCHEFRSFAIEHPGLYDAHTRGTSLTEDEAALARLRAPIPVIQEAFAAYGCDFEDTVHAIRMFRGTVHGFISLERDTAFTLPISVDESFERAIDVFLAGFRSRTGGSESS